MSMGSLLYKKGYVRRPELEAEEEKWLHEWMDGRVEANSNPFWVVPFLKSSMDACQGFFFLWIQSMPRVAHGDIHRSTLPLEPPID